VYDKFLKPRQSFRITLYNHKGCTYRATVRHVTKTWSVVLLNKKYIYSYVKCIVYDKLLKHRQSFQITLYNHKGCTYRAPARYVTKTWRVVLLNKKIIYSYVKRIVYDKFLKPRQSFRITLYNHKGWTYRATVRHVTKTWSVVLLNKKYIYSYVKCIVYDKLLKHRQSFRITLYNHKGCTYRAPVRYVTKTWRVVLLNKKYI